MKLTSRPAPNILAHEQLFRWGFAAELIGGLCVMPLVMLLYELFKGGKQAVALLAVFFSLVGSAIESVSSERTLQTRSFGPTLHPLTGGAL